MKTQRITVLECFTFADGGVRLAHVTYEIGDGERRCVAAYEFKATFPDDDERTWADYDDDGQLLTGRGF